MKLLVRVGWCCWAGWRVLSGWQNCEAANQQRAAELKEVLPRGTTRNTVSLFPLACVARASAQSAARSACAPRRVHLSGLSVLDMSGSVGPCAPAVWRIVAFLAGRTACMRLAKEDVKMVSLSLLTTVLDGASSPCIAGVTFMDHVPGKIEGHIPGTRVMTATKSIGTAADVRSRGRLLNSTLSRPWWMVA